MYKIKYIFLLISFVSYLDADIDTLKLAPLPMSSSIETTKVFLPFARYLNKISNKNIELMHFTNYEDILQSLKTNRIDLAYLGPLPYASLSMSTNSIVPLVGFYENDGSKGYHCVLIASSIDSIDFNNLKGKKIDLTQPLSTCGYFMTSQLLRDLSPNSIEDLKYKYVKKHSKVAQNIIKGNALLGGVKDAIAREYKSLGIRVLKSSKRLPGFVLVANTNTIPKEQILKIQKKLLNTPKSIYSKWGKKISYGMFEAKSEDFNLIRDGLKNMNIPNKGNY